MATNTVNFFQPGTEAAIDANSIARQRQIAEMLMQRGMTSPEGQMVSGHFVAPSKAAYVSQLVSALVGGLQSRQADERERTLAQTLAAGRAKEANDFLGALNGTPARTIPPVTPNDDEGNPMPAAQVAATPADRNRALAIALASQSPQMQAMGGELMKRQMDAAELQDALKAAGIAAPSAGGGASSVAASAVPAASAGAMPSGVPPGVNPQALALMLSKNAQANKLGGVIQDLSKPQVLAEGGTLLERGPNGAFAPTYIAPKTEAGIAMGRGPNGMSAALVPGFAEAKGTIAGAEANARQSAEAANALQQIDTPDGPRMVTRAQAVQMAGGGMPRTGMANPTETAMARNAALTDDPSAAAAREIAALQGDLAKVPDAASKKLIQDEIDRLTAQRQKYGNAAPAPAQQPGIALQDDTSKKFGQTVATQSAEALLAGRDKAKSAVDAINNIQQARASIGAGAFQGSGAEAKLAVAKFINANIPGINIDPNKVANTDYLKSTLGVGLLSEAKTLGSNPSNADANRINDIVGSIGKDPQAMNKMLDWREEMARRAIEGHNATVQDAEGRGMKSPYDLRVKLPEMPAQKPQATAGRTFKDFGYATAQDAIRDAQRVLQTNPGARAEITKRLQSMGVALPSGAQGGW